LFWAVADESTGGTDVEVPSGKKMDGGSGGQQRRLQRLQEILDELVTLTDWKKL
jgi:hypothetical protein